MAISYNRLWKQLIDHGLSKTDMMHRAKISTNVLARLSKGEPVSMDSMEKICTMLGCNIGDVMEFIPDTENGWHYQSSNRHRTADLSYVCPLSGRKRAGNGRI